MSLNEDLKPLTWVGSSKKDLMAFPKHVRREIGRAITSAQFGGKAPNAKLLKHIGGSVLEVVENFDKDTYRAVYTIRFSDRVYVLHCFQKKSRRGIQMDRKDRAMIDTRLKMAVAHHKTQ